MSDLMVSLSPVFGLRWSRSCGLVVHQAGVFAQGRGAELEVGFGAAGSFQSISVPLTR